jgi:hypothetical protein
MPVGSSGDQGQQHYHAAKLRAEIVQLSAFIGSLHDIAPRRNVVAFCEEALASWQSRAMSVVGANTPHNPGIANWRAVSRKTGIRRPVTAVLAA